MKPVELPRAGRLRTLIIFCEPVPDETLGARAAELFEGSAGFKEMSSSAAAVRRLRGWVYRVTLSPSANRVCAAEKLRNDAAIPSLTRDISGRVGPMAERSGCRIIEAGFGDERDACRFVVYFSLGVKSSGWVAGFFWIM